MQRLGQFILCLTLLLSALFGIGPVLGAFEAPNLTSVTAAFSRVSAAQVVPLALMLIFATLILLSTPRNSGQDQ